MNYSLYLLSEYFRSPGQYISLPLDWAVCNTLAVQLLTKGNVNARLPPGPTTGTCLLAHSLVSLLTAAKFNSVRHPTFGEPQFHSTECLQTESYACSLPAVSGGQWWSGVSGAGGMSTFPHGLLWDAMRRQGTACLICTWLQLGEMYSAETTIVRHVTSLILLWNTKRLMMGLAHYVGVRSVLNCNQLQSFSHMFLILLTFLEIRFKENFEVYYSSVK